MIPPQYKIGVCKFCNSHLDNYKMGMRARRSNPDGSSAADLSMYHAWCTKCEIKYTNSSDNRPKSWECSNVQEEELTFKATQADLDQIKSDIEERFGTDNDFIMDLWEEFLSMKKGKDIFYKYKQKKRDIIYHGIAIKRGQFIIANYMSDYSHSQV